MSFVLPKPAGGAVEADVSTPGMHDLREVALDAGTILTPSGMD